MVVIIACIGILGLAFYYKDKLNKMFEGPTSEELKVYQESVFLYVDEEIKRCLEEVDSCYLKIDRAKREFEELEKKIDKKSAELEKIDESIESKLVKLQEYYRLTR